MTEFSIRDYVSEWEWGVRMSLKDDDEKLKGSVGSDDNNEV